MRARVRIQACKCVAAAAWALLAGGAAAQGLKPPTELERAAVVATDPVREKDYLLPAQEIIGFDFLLNRINHATSGSHDYDVTFASIRRNLRSTWAVDDDPFHINQLGHPYQGSMYYGFARSAGLSFWESMGYTFAGSIGWELFGENTRPSINDQIASGVGGGFLGESLFRMASLVLEHGHGGPWREAVATAISPSTGYNRLVYGKRFDTIFASRNPDYYSRLQLGLMGTAQHEQGLSTLTRRNEAQVNFSMEYGLPGKDGYRYLRPFDYFAFEATGSSANVFETVMTRGLLYGTDYSAGKRYRGVWGLYGSYDYISPQTFRISSTALSLGTTGQWRANDRYVVQGSAMAGVGYAAVGSVHASNDQDYHYGTTPQALLALRVINSDRASLDLTAREYFVTRASASTGPGGHDNILRAEIGLTTRVHNLHAFTVKYLWNRRNASFPGLDSQRQTRGTVGIFYTLLGQDRFGTVDWR